MTPPRLQGMNLNLVLVLDALLLECNVTRAARRLGMTQSAVSHALGSLRELLGDPVLVRAKTGMALTQRAVQIAPRLRRSLEMLEHALSTLPEFEPSRAQGTLSLAAPDFLIAIIGPKLIKTVAREAPGIELRLRELRVLHAQETLFTDGTDLLIGPDVPPEGGVSSTPVLTDQFACALRARHPLLTRTTGYAPGPEGALEPSLELDAFLDFPHLLIASNAAAEACVDSALHECGAKRRIAARVESFLAALALVAETDLILTAPRSVLLRALERSADSQAIQVLRLPLSLPPIELRAFWDVRKDGDPRFTWFLSHVRKTLTD